MSLLYGSMQVVIMLAIADLQLLYLCLSFGSLPFFLLLTSSLSSQALPGIRQNLLDQDAVGMSVISCLVVR